MMKLRLTAGHWIPNGSIYRWFPLKRGGGEEDQQGVVEFIAIFKEKGVTRRHHEKSRFEK